MECNIWEEKGLLYMAGELDENEKQSFKVHLVGCEICQTELQTYSKEKEMLFRPEMFEDEPSPYVDREIIRVCSQPIKPVLQVPLIPAFVKNTLFALLILAVGFGGGAYFAGLKVASEIKTAGFKTGEQNIRAAENRGARPLSQVAASQKDEDDSLADSVVSDSAQIFKRGNLDMQGVVPVDLTNE